MAGFPDHTAHGTPHAASRAASLVTLMLLTPAEPCKRPSDMVCLPSRTLSESFLPAVVPGRTGNAFHNTTLQAGCAMSEFLVPVKSSQGQRPCRGSQGLLRRRLRIIKGASQTTNVFSALLRPSWGYLVVVYISSTAAWYVSYSCGNVSQMKVWFHPLVSCWLE